MQFHLNLFEYIGVSARLTKAGPPSISKQKVYHDQCAHHQPTFKRLFDSIDTAYSCLYLMGELSATMRVHQPDLLGLFTQHQMPYQVVLSKMEDAGVPFKAQDWEQCVGREVE